VTNDFGPDLEQSDILHSLAGGVLRLTLNRPDRHNAIDDALIVGLTRAVEAAGQNPAVRVVLIAGAGPSFCAGADLKWMKSLASASEAANRQDALVLQRLFAVIDTLPKPVVARVQGPAIGGGCGIAACADIVVAGPRAAFALSEVRLGLAPAVISPFVVRKIGPSRARELFLTADRIDAATALLYGLAHRVVTTDDALDAEVDRVIASLLKGAPGAQAASKELAREADTWPEPAERTAALIATLRVGEEAQEGMRAFLEKRPPNWTVAAQRPA
jgi:methylglutaconyl-CoA hydratase